MARQFSQHYLLNNAVVVDCEMASSKESWGDHQRRVASGPLAFLKPTLEKRWQLLLKTPRLSRPHLGGSWMGLPGKTCLKTIPGPHSNIYTLQGPIHKCLLAWSKQAQWCR